MARRRLFSAATSAVLALALLAPLWGASPCAAADIPGSGVASALGGGGATLSNTLTFTIQVKPGPRRYVPTRVLPPAEMRAGMRGTV